MTYLKEEDLYKKIAENIRTERKKLGISQFILAEQADVSLDTIKGIESGRRTMRLDTYLKITEALKTTPIALLYGEQSEEYIERFRFLIYNRNKNEKEFILYMIEQLLKGQDDYLKE